jgi:hypothetical protein
LKQIIHLDDQLEKEIILLEKECEIICHKLEQEIQAEFVEIGKRIVIELIRMKNGKCVDALNVFEANYESFIELGFETNGEYFPNGYIPIWKCKSEWFQNIGYLTNRSLEELEKIIGLIVKEILEDIKGD